MVKTVCGAKVLTWGTHPGAGNGMLEYLNSNFYGGNIGHAAVLLTFPANEQGRQLIEKYCKSTGIPYERKKIKIPLAHKDKTNKFVSDPNAAFEEDVYQVYWSWWPDEIQGQKEGAAGKFELKGDRAFDPKSERRGTPFLWNAKWAEYFKPEVRYHKGTMGGRPMPYGPTEVIHQRNLGHYEIEHLDMRAKLEAAIQKGDAMGFIERRIQTKLDDREKDPEKVLEYSDLAGSEKLLLKRFFPEWLNSVKGAGNITNEKFNALLKDVQYNAEYYDAIQKIFLAEGLTRLIHYLNSSKEHVPILIRRGKKEYFEVLSQALGADWKDKVLAHRKENNKDLELTKEQMNTLDLEDINYLTDLSKEQLLEIKKNKRVSATLEYEKIAVVLALVKKAKHKYRKIDEGEEDDAQKLVQKRKAVLSILKKIEGWDLNFLTVLLPPKKQWKDLVKSGITANYLNRLETLLNERQKKNKKEIVPDFPRKNLFRTLKKDPELFLTEGTPPEGVVTLPIQPIGDSKIGRAEGLNVENMLKEMVRMTRAESEGFQILKKNCSKTTDSILEAGATQDYQKDFFRNKAFGYFGNPQEAFNNAQNFVFALEKGKPNVFAKVFNLNPIEQFGGFLIGKWVDNKKPKEGKGVMANVAWFIKEATLIVSLLVVGVVASVLNPLRTVRGAKKFIGYATKKDSLILKTIAYGFLAPIAVLLSPLAAVQWVVNAIFAPLSKSKIKAPKKKALKNREASFEEGEELEDMDNIVERKKKILDAKKESEIARQVASQEKIIYTEDPLKALIQLKHILDNSRSIPVLSYNSKKAVFKYLTTHPTLPEDFKGLGSSALDIFSQLNDKAYQRLRKVQKEVIETAKASAETLSIEPMDPQVKDPSDLEPDSEAHAHGKNGKPKKKST